MLRSAEPVIFPNISASVPTISWPFINVIDISYFFVSVINILRCSK